MAVSAAQIIHEGRMDPSSMEFIELQAIVDTLTTMHGRNVFSSSSSGAATSMVEGGFLKEWWSTFWVMYQSRMPQNASRQRATGIKQQQPKQDDAMAARKQLLMIAMNLTGLAERDIRSLSMEEQNALYSVMQQLLAQQTMLTANGNASFMSANGKSSGAVSSGSSSAMASVTPKKRKGLEQTPANVYSNRGATVSGSVGGVPSVGAGMPLMPSTAVPNANNVPPLSIQQMQHANNTIYQQQMLYMLQQQQMQLQMNSGASGSSTNASVSAASGQLGMSMGSIISSTGNVLLNSLQFPPPPSSPASALPANRSNRVKPVVPKVKTQSSNATNLTNSAHTVHANSSTGSISLSAASTEATSPKSPIVIDDESALLNYFGTPMEWLQNTLPDDAAMSASVVSNQQPDWFFLTGTKPSIGTIDLFSPTTATYAAPMSSSALPRDRERDASAQQQVNLQKKKPSATVNSTFGATNATSNGVKMTNTPSIPKIQISETSQSSNRNDPASFAREPTENDLLFVTESQPHLTAVPRTESGQYLQFITQLGQHTVGTKAASTAFSPDGLLLASGGYDRRVLIFSTQTQQLVATLDGGHVQQITQIKFCPWGDQLILATASFDKTIQIWNLTGSVPIASAATKGSDNATIEGGEEGLRYQATVALNAPSLILRDIHEEAIWSLDFIPSFEANPSPPCNNSAIPRLASIDSSGKLVIWNISFAYKAVGEAITSVSALFMTTIKSDDDRSVTIRQLRCKKTKNGAILAITNGNYVEFFDCQTHSFLSPFLASQADQAANGDQKAKPLVFLNWGNDVDEGRLLLITTTVEVARVWDVTQLLQSPNASGNWIGSGKTNATAAARSQSAHPIASHLILADKVTCCVFVNASSGRQLAVLGGYQSIYLWEFDAQSLGGGGTRQPQPVKYVAHEGLVVSLAFNRSTGHPLMGSASHDGKILLWGIHEEGPAMGVGTSLLMETNGRSRNGQQPQAEDMPSLMDLTNPNAACLEENPVVPSPSVDNAIATTDDRENSNFVLDDFSL